MRGLKAYAREPRVDRGLRQHEQQPKSESRPVATGAAGGGGRPYTRIILCGLRSCGFFLLQYPAQQLSSRCAREFVYDHDFARQLIGRNLAL